MGRNWIAVGAAGALVMAAALGLTGCAHGKAGPGGGGSRPAEEYYPLAVGNRWTYDVTFLGEKRQDTVEIVKLEGGYFVDNKGNKLTTDAFGVRDESRYLLQEPVEMDHTWKNVVSMAVTEHYAINSVGVRCEVPAGKFDDCVTVTSTARVDATKVLENALTFARGVGLVSVAVDLTKNGQRIPQTRLALTSYQLAPKAQPAGQGTP